MGRHMFPCTTSQPIWRWWRCGYSHSCRRRGRRPIYLDSRSQDPPGDLVNSILSLTERVECEWVSCFGSIRGRTLCHLLAEWVRRRRTFRICRAFEKVFLIGLRRRPSSVGLNFVHTNLHPPGQHQQPARAAVFWSGRGFSCCVRFMNLLRFEWWWWFCGWLAAATCTYQWTRGMYNRILIYWLKGRTNCHHFITVHLPRMDMHLLLAGA